MALRSAVVAIALEQVERPAARIFDLRESLQDLLVRSAARRGLPFGDVVLLPNLGDPVPAGSQLVIAFQAIADRKHGALDASIDLKRNGAVVTSLPLRLPEPKDDRLVRFATRFSTGRLDAGAYVLTLTVRQDKTSVERDAALMIRDAADPAR